MLYEYAKELEALQAWLAAPSTNRGAQFFRDFFTKYQDKHAEFHKDDEEDQSQSNYSEHLNHVLFREAFIRTIKQASADENLTYTHATKQDIKKCVQEGLFLTIEKQTYSCACGLDEMVKELVEITGENWVAAKGASGRYSVERSTDPSDDAPPPSSSFSSCSMM